MKSPTVALHAGPGTVQVAVPVAGTATLVTGPNTKAEPLYMNCASGTVVDFVQPAQPSGPGMRAVGHRA